jgi:trans-aconitate methyltransferase
LNWADWVDRWERQQERYLVDREGRFGLMLDYAEALLPTEAPRVLDLCCGNGALTRRVLARFPGARVTAVDWDPVHLEIARQVLPDEVEIVEADVTTRDWSDALGADSVDLVVSATALHWLERAALEDLYARLAILVAPGGLFVNADHLPPEEPTIALVGEELTEAWQDANFAHGEETHDGFHEAAGAAPELRAASELRARRFGPHDEGHSMTQNVGFHRAALRQAGFDEVTEVWRHRNDAVLLAYRRLAE